MIVWRMNSPFDILKANFQLANDNDDTDFSCVCLFVYSSTFANVSQMIDNIYYILAYRRSFYIHNNSIKIVNLKRAQIQRIRIFRWSILASHLKLPQLNRSR